MKISHFLTNNSFQETNCYYITNEGLSKSPKNTTNEDIIIGNWLYNIDKLGRQDFDENNIIPNDIILPYHDRLISRVHSKICIKNGFKVKKPINESMLAFLCATRCQNSYYWLPLHLLRLINRFAKGKKEFVIEF